MSDKVIFIYRKKILKKRQESRLKRVGEKMNKFGLD